MSRYIVDLDTMVEVDATNEEDALQKVYMAIGEAQKLVAELRDNAAPESEIDETEEIIAQMVTCAAVREDGIRAVEV